ncbi:hypothetical protein SDC9_89347 [bioreactor metagenome]|uniref:Uncharacterized protein n=1 Tax=bioreactor metagenome TaxID=1076179 RepID=A0A644ZQM2_9ZZZZ
MRKHKAPPAAGRAAELKQPARPAVPSVKAAGEPGCLVGKCPAGEGLGRSGAGQEGAGSGQCARQALGPVDAAQGGAAQHQRAGQEGGGMLILAQGSQNIAVEGMLLRTKGVKLLLPQRAEYAVKVGGQAQGGPFFADIILKVGKHPLILSVVFRRKGQQKHQLLKIRGRQLCKQTGKGQFRRSGGSQLQGLEIDGEALVRLRIALGAQGGGDLSLGNHHPPPGKGLGRVGLLHRQKSGAQAVQKLEEAVQHILLTGEGPHCFHTGSYGRGAA